MARKNNIPSLAGVSKKDRTEAWLAASRFKEMQPQLTSFARSITGNGKVQVNATHLGPHSIGNKIFIRPPLALGRNYPHDRQVCGKRGDDGRQECPACRVREVVDFYLYHEIGHIWCGTQDKPNTSDWNLFETISEMWHPREACDHLDEMYSAARQYNEVMPIANTFHRYLGLIFNALEDARVNEGMFDARPGLRRSFEVNIERMMSEGMQYEETGEMQTWHDAPADSQFTVGLSMVACNYPPEGWFHPDIVEALNDSRVLDVTSRARHARSVHEVFELAVKALLVANAMGFCIIPKCEIPSLNNEPEDPDSGTESGDAGEPGGSSGSSTSSASDSADSDGDEADPGRVQGTPEQSEADSDSEESEPEADSDSGGLPSDDVEVPDDRSGAPDGSDSADDDPADETDSTGGDGDDREDNDASDDGSTGSPSGGGTSDGPAESGQQAGPETGEVTGASSSGGASGNDGSSDGESERNPDDVPGDGDGDEGLPPEGSDDTAVERDSDADREIESDSEDDNANPWAIAAPSETGSDDDPLPMAGTVEDAERALAPFLMHGTEDYDGMLEDMLGEALEDVLNDVEEGTREFVNGQPIILVAISQVAFFDDPSAVVAGVEMIKFPCSKIDWVAGESYTDYSPSEMNIGAAVLHARRVFQENNRAKLDRNQRSGKVNSRVLAKRAPVGDDRLFGKKTQPKKRSYLVIITGDCSGSTSSYGRSQKIRRMMMAQGDILHRIGVPFIMMGHSAARARVKDFWGPNESDYWQYALMVKEENEGWGPAIKNRLAAMGPVSENLDGHTLEYCRKLADQSRATDVIIIYYTDGEMPAANASEEREILVREVKTCKQRGYHLLGVGINTDSPKRYGLKTVRVESDEDIRLVVEQLEKELTQ